MMKHFIEQMKEVEESTQPLTWQKLSGVGHMLYSVFINSRFIWYATLYMLVILLDKSLEKLSELVLYNGNS